MAMAFTYSRLPEHQVAAYYDGSDKAGAIFILAQIVKPFKTS